MVIPNSVYLIPGARKLQSVLNWCSFSYVPPPPGNPEDHPYKILLVHAHPNPNSFSAKIAESVEDAAQAAGHMVRRITLYSYDDSVRSYPPALTKTERISYYTEEKQLDPVVHAHLESLQWCDTVIFVYPTWWMNVPAILKGFFDRTLVPGETFDFQRSPSETKSSTGLIPKLTNIHRVVGISTYGAPFPIVTLAGDNGRRMINNAIRPILHSNATLQWLGLYDMDKTTPEIRSEFLDEVRQLVSRL